MSVDSGTDDGFSLVEVIIAVVLLAVIAVALLPALWLGVRSSARQSSTATATRYMNSLVEQARDTPTCAYLGSINTLPAVNDGRGIALTTSTSTVTGCTPGSTATLTVTIVGGNQMLASTTALIYIP